MEKKSYINKLIISYINNYKSYKVGNIFRRVLLNYEQLVCKFLHRRVLLNYEQLVCKLHT